MDLNRNLGGVYKGQDVVDKSQITFNGIYKKNIRFFDYPNMGFVKTKNLVNDGKFLIHLEDVIYKSDSMYATYTGKKASAVIATALNTIKLPAAEFESLAVALNNEHQEIVNDGSIIKSNLPCSHFNLGNFTIQIDGLHYIIPPYYWTREIDESCVFLF